MSATDLDTRSSNLGVIWGAAGIAKALGITRRQAFHMLSTKQLKGARKLGGRWVITRDVLAANFRAEEQSHADGGKSKSGV